MNRLDRLFGILLLLQSKKYVTAEKIAEKYKISVRTVYRDIKTLIEQGVPITYEAPDGYCIVQGFFLPPVSFTSEEANALLLVESLANVFSDNSIRKNYSTALDKVKNVLRHQQKEKIEVLNENIRMQVPECFNIGDYEYLSIIQNAVAAKSVIQIEYKNNKEEVSKRRVEPIGLIFYALSWHLIAYCQMRRDYRDFKISRIIRMVDMHDPFTIDEHLPLGEYMKQLPVGY